MNSEINLAAVQEPWTIAFLIGVIALIFGYLYFRKKPEVASDEPHLQQIELKLKGVFSPDQPRIKAGRPVQMLIHRFDLDPTDEIFEIGELDIYELLPAAHTTIISFLSEKKGKFKMILAGEREAGLMIVD